MTTRILVTNDDGIDAPGIGFLVEAMADLGDVVVVAPDREFSGASQAVGSLMHHTPGLHRRSFPGAVEAWAVSGPPALCVVYADIGVVGERPDIVVSGINPGANIARSVYHSGTLGACLSARNCGWSGVAISQAAPVTTGPDGQAYYDTHGMQKWSVAAEVAHTFVGALIADLPQEPVVANVNVPNLDLDDIAGWRLADVARHPAAVIVDPIVTPHADDPDAFDVTLRWQRNPDPEPGTDTDTLWAHHVSISYITRLTHHARADLGGPEEALAGLLGPASVVARR